MADIVQLEEKGNLLYPKTHTSAIDGLDETLVKKTGDEDIAGVKNFTSVPQINNVPIAVDKGTVYKEITLDSTVNANIKSGYIRLWRIGNMVIVGSYLTITGPVRWVNVAKIPEGFEPHSTGSFGISYGSTGGEQIPATLYMAGSNFRVLTTSTIPSAEYPFQGSGIYYTEKEFPS
ncbi:hypothetical protein JZO66_09310 [Enterococcus sp. DIV0242_7C1]|uniref:Uncharacterized protein n=1 Tax=Candidatus Enterococcus dunnyi TaxID=1834192 RepID=A0A200J7P0_9ENTE|nr:MULTISPECIES: hypothetical protein [unclassified Enterococcus]MBO0470745.1 hypothetical protein [Enterococcus sp. DIV0242_7C1]OUZ33194.1 hypothetical protein A5889_001903 [Enterococcus sp. 9D6_DIV0238]